MRATELLLRRLEIRDRLEPEEAQAVLDLPVNVVTYDRRQTIVRMGSLQNKSSILLNGWVGRSNTLVDGRRQITQLHIAGDFFDLHSFLMKRLEHDVVALTQCTVADVDHGRLKELTERFPHLTRLLWMLTLIDAATYREWMTLMGRADALQHIAFILCELYVRQAAVGIAADHVMDFPLTQEELGDVCGLTAIHINRVLQELRRDGLIVTADRRIRFPDWDRLVALAQFDATYLSLGPIPR